MGRAMVAGIALAAALVSADLERPALIAEASAQAGWRHLANADVQTWQRAARSYRRLQATQWVIRALATKFPSETEAGWFRRGDQLEQCISKAAPAMQPREPIINAAAACLALGVGQ